VPVARRVQGLESLFLVGQIEQGFHLLARERTPLAGAQTARIQGPDIHPRQTHDLESHIGKDPAHLSVAPFAQCHQQNGRGSRTATDEDARPARAAI
jgi:hypothetical protein